MQNGSSAIPAAAAASVPSVSSAPPASLPVALEDVIHHWALCWTKEKKSSLDWIALDSQMLSEKRKKDSFYSQANVPWLTLKPVRDEDIIPTAEPAITERQTNVKSVLGASPDIKNHTSITHPTTVSLKKALATTCTVKCSSEMTYSAGFELSGGMPHIGNFKATVGLSLKKGTSEDTTEMEQKEEVLTQVINAQGGKHTLADIELTETITEKQLRCLLHLQGGIIISCKDKVEHRDSTHPNRAGKHHRWFIAIKDIFEDIQRFLGNNSLPKESRQLFKQAISNITMNEHDVQFHLRVNVVSKTHIAPKINIQESQLPGSSVQAALPASAAAPAATASMYLFGAIADRPQAEARAKHYLGADELNKTITTTAEAASKAGLFANHSGPRTFSVGCAHATEQGAKAYLETHFAPSASVTQSKEMQDEEGAEIQFHDDPEKAGGSLQPAKK